MKTKLSKLMDVDFYITVALILVCGIFMMVLIAMNVYITTTYWPLYVVAGAAFMLLIWKVMLQYLIVKYQDE